MDFVFQFPSQHDGQQIRRTRLQTLDKRADGIGPRADGFRAKAKAVSLEIMAGRRNPTVTGLVGEWHLRPCAGFRHPSVPSENDANSVDLRRPQKVDHIEKVSWAGFTGLGGCNNAVRAAVVTQKGADRVEPDARQGFHHAVDKFLVVAGRAEGRVPFFPLPNRSDAEIVYAKWTERLVCSCIEKTALANDDLAKHSGRGGLRSDECKRSKERDEKSADHRTRGIF